MSHALRWSMPLVCSFMLLGITGCQTGTGPAMKNQVTIDRRAFSPATLTVSTGTTVTWVNKEDAVHTVTADDNSFDSGKLDTNQTFTHKFDTAGTYPYHCKLHYGMNGSVVVK